MSPQIHGKIERDDQPVQAAERDSGLHTDKKGQQRHRNQGRTESGKPLNQSRCEKNYGNEYECKHVWLHLRVSNQCDELLYNQTWISEEEVGEKGFYDCSNLFRDDQIYLITRHLRTQGAG